MRPCGRHGVTLDEGSNALNRVSNLPGSVNVSYGTYIKDESNQLLGSSKGLSWGYIAEGPGKSIECWKRFMSMSLHDHANILHGVRGGWTMRSKIINSLLVREDDTQRTTMEKWIGCEEEGSLIPRGRGTPDRIEGSELRDTKTPT